MKKLGLANTFVACYMGFFIQAIVCGFAPLLFVIFNREYSISLPLITLLSTVNFVAQFATDGLAVFFVHRIGYRKSGIIAHLCAFLGLLLIGVVAPRVENIYVAIMSAVVLYSIGGGLLEVILSPIIENVPTKNKSAEMSMLHSMFAVGSAATILLTTFALKLFGWQSWNKIALLWSVLPFLNMIYFMFIPINEASTEVKRVPVWTLFKDKVFLGFLLVMMCGGAAEIGISQWASAFAESSLGISKAAGDVLGPCAFALMMAAARMLYSRVARFVSLSNSMMYCGVFAAVCYLAAALVPIPFVALISCGLCGFAVGILWPGALSLAAKAYPAAGGALFAVMALAGDFGCTLGPTVVGFVASMFGGELRAGLLAGALFPAVMVVGLFALKRKDK
ncbi:MAG: MFS transporter [Clostridia bacterium]|nr:MFS transporter [Clostridia bacterium]